MPTTPSGASVRAISSRVSISAGSTYGAWNRPPGGVKYQMPTGVARFEPERVQMREQALSVEFVQTHLVAEVGQRHGGVLSRKSRDYSSAAIVQIAASHRFR